MGHSCTGVNRWAREKEREGKRQIRCKQRRGCSSSVSRKWFAILPLTQPSMQASTMAAADSTKMEGFWSNWKCQGRRKGVLGYRGCKMGVNIVGWRGCMCMSGVEFLFFFLRLFDFLGEVHVGFWKMLRHTPAFNYFFLLHRGHRHKRHMRARRGVWDSWAHPFSPCSSSYLGGPSWIYRLWVCIIIINRHWCAWLPHFQVRCAFGCR